MIGSERKEERLQYLKNYWVDRVKELPGVRIHTSQNPEFAGAIALFSIDGKEPGEVANLLFRNHKVHTVAINWENIHGVRVTPKIYTGTRDLDVLVRGVEEIVKS